MNIPDIGKRDKLNEIFRFLPAPLCAAVERIVRTLPLGQRSVLELRLRAEGRVSLVTDSGVRDVAVGLTYDDVSEILSKLTGGSLYAHRDTITKGYVTVGGGMRVGVCGRARYEGGELVGITEVRSLVFRLPHGICDVENELFSIWRSGIGSGMIIYSPPLGGKTTAIRALAARIGQTGVRVCVVDERLEFLPEDYRSAEVELLRGYSKARGIEIAVRTLGAGVLIVDEIGASEAESVASAMMLGVPMIATAHASSAEELLEGGAFSPIVRTGAFRTLVGISYRGARRRIECTRIGREQLVGLASRDASQ